MTSRTDVERELDRYLAEGAVHVPDRVLDAALGRIARTSQWHALWMPWRFNTMTSFLKPAIAGAAITAALIFGGFLVTRPTVGPGVSPATSPLPSSSSSARLEPMDTSGWTNFKSQRYGYVLAFPPAWVPKAATTTFGRDRDIDRAEPPSTSWDYSRGQGFMLYAYSVELAPGVSEDEWIASQVEGCSPLSEDARPIVVDGHVGRAFTRLSCHDAQAFVPIDGRLHVFVAWYTEPVVWPGGSPESLGQEAFLDAFLSRVYFRP